MKRKRLYNRILAAGLAGILSISMLVSSTAPVIAAESDTEAEISVQETTEEIRTQDNSSETTPEAQATNNTVAEGNAVAEETNETADDLAAENSAEEETTGTTEATNADSSQKEDAFQNETSDSNDISSDDNNSNVPDTDVSSEGVIEGENKEIQEVGAEGTVKEAENKETEPETQETADKITEENTDETPNEIITWSADSDGITVSAKAKTGVLPDGSELKAYRLYDTSVKDTLDNHGTDYDGYIAFDISFVNDGNIVEPDGDVIVTFDLKDMIPKDTETVEIKHFDESSGSLDIVTVADTGSSSDGDVSVEGTSATAEFEVSSFSTFAIVWKNADKWPETTYLNVNCKDQYGNLLTDDYVPKLVILEGASSKIEFSADNEKLAIPASGSGTSAVTYTFTRAEAVISGQTDSDGNEKENVTLSNVTAIEAEHETSTKWLYTVIYKDGELEKKISGLTSDQISLSLYYSNEDVSVSFNLNGGSGTTPDTIKGKGGTKIKLPDPSGNISRDGYTFIGWAEISNLKQDTDFHKVYKAGEEYYLPATGAKTLYAAWTSSNYGNATFYIRLDAKVAPEPSQYGNALYTAGELITNTVKEQRWMIDMDATKHNGVHVENAVSNNMETLPTASQLKARINAKRSSIGFTVAVNSDGKLYVNAVSDANNSLGVTVGDILYVHWYVQKWANAGGSFWNVDGVLLTENTIEVTYHGNPNGTDIANLPAGYSINPGTDVTVGVSGAATEGDGHSLLYTTKTGYELVGWNTKADGTGETYKVGDVFRPIDDITLYAMWSKIPRGSVKITKQVTGNIEYGDSAKEYKMRISIPSTWVNGAEYATKYDSVTDETGDSLGTISFTNQGTNDIEWKSYDFTLKDGESIVISGLYDSTMFKIEELESGYNLTYDGYDSKEIGNNRIETGVTKNVVLRNGINDIVETGVRTGGTPVWAGMMIVIWGYSAVFVYKRTRNIVTKTRR